MGHEPRAARPAEAHLRRRHHHPRHHRRHLAGRHAAACAPPSIYDGETYDARLDRAGWDQPGFNGGWRSAVERNETMAVEPSQAPPIKVIETLAAQDGHPAHARHHDLRPRPELRRLGAHHGPRRRRHAVRLRFGEILNADGTLYTTNLRSAQQTDTFTLRGTGGTETYEPRFTYHGFRYVEVTGPAPTSTRSRAASSAPTCRSSARSQLQTRS